MYAMEVSKGMITISFFSALKFEAQHILEHKIIIIFNYEVANCDSFKVLIVSSALLEVLF